MTIMTSTTATDRDRWDKLSMWMSSNFVGCQIWSNVAHPGDAEHGAASREHMSSVLEESSSLSSQPVLMWLAKQEAEAFNPDGWMRGPIDIFHRSDEESLALFIAEAERLGLSAENTDYLMPHNGLPALRISPNH